MSTTDLGAFIADNRHELIRRCRAKVTARITPPPTPAEIDHGVPLFLTQIVAQLGADLPQTREIRTAATQHGKEQYFEGLTVSQVVHDYGDVCQSVTELAGELQSSVSTDDFRTLNRCLDDAIAGAVTEFARQERIASAGLAAGRSVQMRNLIFTAITAMEALQSGTVGIDGTTGRLLARTLLTMRSVMTTVSWDLPVVPARYVETD